MSTSDLHYAVELAADRAGHLEYSERRHDVEVCGESEIWCWPFGDADEAYLSRVTVPLVCNDIGIALAAWPEWSTIWRQAFRGGYQTAHEHWEKGQVTE